MFQKKKNSNYHNRTKYRKMNCHFTRIKVMEGLRLQLFYLPTKYQLANIFMKILPSIQFK